MQTLTFTYSTDGASSFKLEINSVGSRITGGDLILMGKYIQLLFATIRQITEINKTEAEDIDELIRKLMNGGEEDDLH